MNINASVWKEKELSKSFSQRMRGIKQLTAELWFKVNSILCLLNLVLFLFSHNQIKWYICHREAIELGKEGIIKQPLILQMHTRSKRWRQKL